jgi:hypothetical protein
MPLVSPCFQNEVLIPSRYIEAFFTSLIRA